MNRCETKTFSLGGNVGLPAGCAHSWRLTAYAYDAGDRVRSETLVGPGLTTTYVYDANGNLVRELDDINQVTATYAYDHENRVTSVSYPALGESCAHAYAPSGARTSSNRSPMTHLAYDFHDPYGFEDVPEGYDATVTGIARYVHGLGPDEPLGVEWDRAWYAYHTDALGSVTRLTDAAQGSPPGRTATTPGASPRAGRAPWRTRFSSPVGRTTGRPPGSTTPAPGCTTPRPDGS